MNDGNHEVINTKNDEKRQQVLKMIARFEGMDKQTQTNDPLQSTKRLVKAFGGDVYANTQRESLQQIDTALSSLVNDQEAFKIMTDYLDRLAEQKKPQSQPPSSPNTTSPINSELEKIHQMIKEKVGQQLFDQFFGPQTNVTPGGFGGSQTPTPPTTPGS